MLIYKNNPTLPQGGPDIGLKVGILAEIGNMLHECALGNRLSLNVTSAHLKLSIKIICILMLKLYIKKLKNKCKIFV